MSGWTGNSKPGPLHNQKGALPLSYMYPGQLVSMVLGQTTTILFFKKFLPLRNSQQTHEHIKKIPKSFLKNNKHRPYSLFTPMYQYLNHIYYNRNLIPFTIRSYVIFFGLGILIILSNEKFLLRLIHRLSILLPY